MAVLSTPIRNGDADWNCQNWVGDALGRLVRKGFISGVQKEEGIDAMVDAVLEGADEG